jgi:hypothetical protein
MLIEEEWLKLRDGNYDKHLMTKVTVNHNNRRKLHIVQFTARPAVRFNWGSHVVNWTGSAGSSRHLHKPQKYSHDKK